MNDVSLYKRPGDGKYSTGRIADFLKQTLGQLDRCWLVPRRHEEGKGLLDNKYNLAKVTVI